MGFATPLRAQLWRDGSENIPGYAKTRDPSMEAYNLLGSQIAFVAGVGFGPALSKGRSCPVGGCLFLRT